MGKLVIEVRILALETTERIGSIAALESGRVIGSQKLSPHKRAAASLVPAIQQLLKKIGWQPADVELVAVPSGPGSFTGLRIGITTAKIFAYACRAEVLGVNTLECIAAGAPGDVERLRVVMNAQRQQVFAGHYRRQAAGNFSPLEPTHIQDVQSWLRQLEPGDTVTGPALHQLAGKLPSTAHALPEALWVPTAEWIGRLAWQEYGQGRRDDIWQLVPQYFRPSAAEEKWQPHETQEQ